jgi:type IV pilus assembly protein PilO
MKIEMKRLTFPRKYLIVLIVLLPVLILGGAYFLVFGAQLRSEAKVAADLKTVRQDLARVNTMRSDLAKARKEYAQLKIDLQEKLAQLPEEKEVPNLLRQVSLAAQETKTRIKYFAPKEVQPQEFYSELPFEMKYSAPYHNIGYFFDGIRKLERIIHVTSFSLESKEAGQKVVLEGTCLAKTYVYNKEPLPKKKEGEKKGEKNEPPKK